MTSPTNEAPADRPVPQSADGESGAATSPWTPSREQWQTELAPEPTYRLDQLWRGLYQDQLQPAEITTLPKALRQRIASSYTPALSETSRQVADRGTTIKWLWTLPDGPRIETVLMHYKHRSTACVSSQAGCAMACGFCATGQAGYERHLSVGEILEQIVAAARQCAADDTRLSNIVYMGMGEPMANLDRVLESIHRLMTDFEIGARKITVSTVGLAPQMRRFASTKLQVGLALSLHAANDDLRNELVPVNKRYPIAELIDCCRQYRRETGRRVSIEWAMIDGVNDRDSDIAELADVARQAQAHVNLIPLNPTPGWPTVGSPPTRISNFARQLEHRGVNVTVRANRGTDIDAACGQLAGSSDPTKKAASSTPQPVTLGRPNKAQPLGTRDK